MAPGFLIRRTGGFDGVLRGFHMHAALELLAGHKTDGAERNGCRHVVRGVLLIDKPGCWLLFVWRIGAYKFVIRKYPATIP
jgi:hypothetical protein